MNKIWTIAMVVVLAACSSDDSSSDKLDCGELEENWCGELAQTCERDYCEGDCSDCTQTCVFELAACWQGATSMSFEYTCGGAQGWVDASCPR